MKTMNYLTNLWRKVKAVSDVQSRDEERISGRVNPRISPTSVRLDSLSIVSRQSYLLKFVARTAAVFCLLVTLGYGQMWGATVTLSYPYSKDYADMWWDGMEDANSYWKITGAAIFAVPITEQPTSNITITISMAYFGSGTEGLERVSASGTESSSTWTLGETASPTSHSGDTYQNEVFTITKSATPSTLAGLDITINRKTGKYLRVNSITVSYTAADCTSRTITMSNFSKDFGAADFVPTHTVSAGSGTKTWTSSNTSVATIVSNQVHIVGAGSTTITLDVAANGGYCAVSKSCTMTVNAIAPTLSHNTSGKELAVGSISSGGATFSKGIVTNKGGANITNYGFIVGTSSDVTYATATKKVETSADIALNTAFGSKSVTGLSANTTYYVRAFAFNGTQYGYSTAVSFTTLQKYAITYNKNDGSGTSEVEYKDHGVNYTISSNKFTRSGYTLKEWNTNSGGSGTVYAKGATYSTNAGLTLHAVWAGTVSFNANSGSGSMAAQTLTSGSSYALPECTFTAPAGKTFKCWAEGSSSGEERAVGYSHTVAGDITFYAVWRDLIYDDFKFSCASLTLTGPTGDLVFITSAASKTVRSQEAFHIEGNGLTPSTALTFTISNPSVASKFAFKKADGSALSTDGSGEIDTDFYVYYTPGEGDTSDGLDQFTTLTASVSGAKPKTATLAGKTVIGRHLPANFVIAAKVDGRWYALPANKANGNPAAIAIRVDDNSNPTTAYCANTNSYTLYQNNTANSEKVILGMTNYKNGSGVSYALFGADATATTIGYSTGLVNGDLGDKYKWTLTQTATSVSAVSDAKYVICRAGKADSLSLRTSTTSATWGTYVYAANSSSRKTITELRLLTLSEVGALSLTVMEWGTDAIAVSYPNGGSASSVQAIVNGGSPAAVTLTSLGGDMYKISTISGLTTTSNFGRSLVITATESGAAKQIVLTIPIIVTDSKTEANLRGYMPGSTAAERNAAAKLVDVVIRNGGTLTTGTGSGYFANLYIYPGGKAKIANNFTAKGNIYMRGGYSFLDNKATYKYPDLCITDGTTTTTKLYYDLYIDNRYYYTFSMPYDVTLESVTDEANNTNFPVWVKHYNGATRASGTHVSGWEWYGDDAEAQHSFFAGVGYEITAKPKVSGRPIAIIRFPVKTGNLTTDAERSVGVAVDNYGKSAYDGGSLAANNVGWNFVGNPYLTEYKAGTASPGNASDTLMLVAQGYEQHIDPTTGAWDGTYDWKASNKRFITVPYDTQTDYHAEAVATYAIPAFSAFFIQTTESGTFYMRGTRPQAAAPARYSAMPKEKAEMHLDVLLRGNGEAVVGKAGLIIHDKYEGGLKDFEDVEQWFVDKNELKTYTFANGAALTYNLTNEEYAKQLIPMGYIATVAGEHTYSLNEENNVSGLEHLWLTDYLTGKTTDLLVRDYTFTTDAGRFDERFAISAVFNQQEVATEVTNTTGGDWTQTIGVYHDGNTLTLRGLPENSSVYVYDMTGKLMTSGEKLHQVASFSIAAQGVYNIRVVNGDKAVTLRSVLH